MTANPKDPPALILLYRSSGSTEELIFTQASISCPKGYTIPAPRIIPAAVYALFSRCAVHQQQITMNSRMPPARYLRVEQKVSVIYPPAGCITRLSTSMALVTAPHTAALNPRSVRNSTAFPENTA